MEISWEVNLVSLQLVEAPSPAESLCGGYCSFAPYLQSGCTMCVDGYY